MKNKILTFTILLFVFMLFKNHSSFNAKAKLEIFPYKALWSSESDIAPSISRDGKYILFQSNRDDVERFSLYAAYKKKDGTLSEPKQFILDESAEFEGQPFFSGKDGKLFYVSLGPRNYGKSEKRTADIWFTKWKNSEWSSPVKLKKPLNTEYIEITPCVSIDGKVLYFSSNRPGGYGGLDIWKSKFKNGKWMKPKNLGSKINSKANEIFPRIHADNKTLYISSNRKKGYGAYDIYVSRKKKKKWSKVQNAGSFVNSKTNDHINGVATDGGNLLISRGESGQEKIYIVTPTPDKMMPTPLRNIRVVAIDKDSKLPLSFSLQIMKKKNNKLVFESDYKAPESVNKNISDSSKEITSHTDYFNQPGIDTFLETPGKYSLFIISDGYLFSNKDLIMKTSSKKDIVKIFELQLLKKGVKLPLKDVYFFPVSARLKKKSKKNLKNIAKFIKLNPKVIFRIEGHTARGKGNMKRNIRLSLRRAKTVRKYLLSQGISKNRIKTKGYGHARPISKNNSRKEIAKNRRVEFVIFDIIE